MKTLLEFKINQVFFNDPLLWLWLMLGVIGLVGLGLLLSWFFGRPVLKFYVDGEVKSMLPCKRGEKLAIPIDLQEYKWFWNKEMTIPVVGNEIVKKRVMCLYSDSAHMAVEVK